MYYLHVGVVYGKLKTSISKHEIVDSEVGVYLQKTAIGKKSDAADSKRNVNLTNPWQNLTIKYKAFKFTSRNLDSSAMLNFWSPIISVY